MTDNTTKGRIYTMKTAPPAADAPSQPQGSTPESGKNPLEQAQNEAAEVLQKKWDELKNGLGTLKDATGLGVSPEIASAARQRVMDGAKDMAKGLGSLVGAPPELVQAAYMSGNPELIATVQKMQAQQASTVQAIADNVKDSVSQAYARNGMSGASAMVLTALGTEVLGGKGIGAVMSAAGKAADIVRLSKTPAQAAEALKREAELARAAGKVDEAALFEGAAAERQAQAVKEASGGKDGVVVKLKSLRLQYLGRTPGKGSKTGKEVQERMRKEGKLRDGDEGPEFQASNGKWYPLEVADMAHHPKDAVSWWNETGRQYGPKSEEVRNWMKDSNNYTLDHYSLNRSSGAKLTEQYLPPLKP